METHEIELQEKDKQQQSPVKKQDQNQSGVNQSQTVNKSVVRREDAMEEYHESDFISLPAKFFQMLLYYGDWAVIIYYIIQLDKSQYKDIENYDKYKEMGYHEEDIPRKEKFFFWLLIGTIAAERFFNLIMIGLDQTSFNMFNMKPYVDSKKQNSNIIQKKTKVSKQLPGIEPPSTALQLIGSITGLDCFIANLSSKKYYNYWGSQACKIHAFVTSFIVLLATSYSAYEYAMFKKPPTQLVAGDSNLMDFEILYFAETMACLAVSGLNIVFNTVLVHTQSQQHSGFVEHFVSFVYTIIGLALKVNLIVITVYHTYKLTDKQDSDNLNCYYIAIVLGGLFLVGFLVEYIWQCIAKKNKSNFYHIIYPCTNFFTAIISGWSHVAYIYSSYLGLPKIDEVEDHYLIVNNFYSVKRERLSNKLFQLVLRILDTIAWYCFILIEIDIENIILSYRVLIFVLTAFQLLTSLIYMIMYFSDKKVIYQQKREQEEEIYEEFQQDIKKIENQNKSMQMQQEEFVMQAQKLDEQIEQLAKIESPAEPEPLAAGRQPQQKLENGNFIHYCFHQEGTDTSLHLDF